MNEQAPEGQTSAPGTLSPPPWPNFGARPADSVAEDTYLSDLDAADAELRDSGGRDSAPENGPIVRDSAQDDDPDMRASAHAADPDMRASAQAADPDSDKTDFDLGDPDVVILPDSATTRANTSPHAAPWADTNRPGYDPGDLVILPDSATSRTHAAAPDDAVAPASAMIRPLADPDAAPAPASAIVPPPADAATPASAIVPPPADAATTPASAIVPPPADPEAATTPASATVLQPADPVDLGARHEQWRSIQSAFVDDPRRSVAAAADLAAQLVGELVTNAQECERALRGEWDRDGVDTEDLRNALRQYRGFIERLPVL